jgi:hypothetical protein
MGIISENFFIENQSAHILCSEAFFEGRAISVCKNVYIIFTCIHIGLPSLYALKAHRYLTLSDCFTFTTPFYPLLPAFKRHFQVAVKRTC